MTKFANAPQHAPETIARFVERGYWNDDTLATHLEKWAKETPDKTAVVAPERTLTYRELWTAACRFANALLDIGIEKGDVVGIQLPSVPEFLIAYYGVTMMGGVLGTLHMPYRAGEMEPLLNHGKMRAMICGAATQAYDAPATVSALKAKVPTLEHVIVVGTPVPKGVLSMADMIEGAAERDIANPPTADDPAILCFTSGTSAAPKGVPRSYRTLTANARIHSRSIALSANDVVMIAPPFTHVFGLLCANDTLWSGATALLLPLFTPEAYAETIQRGRPTVVFSAPAHVAATLKAGLFDGVDLSSTRDVLIAGSVCPPEVAVGLEKLMPNGRVGQLFGMTEVIITMQTPLDGGPEARHYSTGRVTEGIEARAVSLDGKILPPEKEGELQLRGYSIMAGYLDNEEANRAAFTKDGWFKTGDLCVINDDGDIAITGRVKDIINRGGVKINPTDLENLIAAHQNVVQAAIVSMPDEVLGEKACLFVTLVPGGTLTLEEITRYLADNDVAKMRWPERLEIIDEMPMTPTRKVIKGELVKRLTV